MSPTSPCMMSIIEILTMCSHTCQNPAESSSGGDHTEVSRLPFELSSTHFPGQCAYTAMQVAWLRHLGPAFQRALWNYTMLQFMERLYESWFAKWPEAPDLVERRKNVHVSFAIICTS